MEVGQSYKLGLQRQKKKKVKKKNMALVTLGTCGH
jgi:hypothetical protein